MFTQKLTKIHKAGNFGYTTSAVTEARTEHNFPCLRKMPLMVVADLEMGLSESHQ